MAKEKRKIDDDDREDDQPGEDVLDAAREALQGKPGRKAYIGALRDLDDIFAEQCRVYRRIARGELNSLKGNRMSAVLGRAAAVKKIVETDAKLEEVLRLLEAARK